MFVSTVSCENLEDTKRNTMTQFHTVSKLDIWNASTKEKSHLIKSVAIGSIAKKMNTSSFVNIFLVKCRLTLENFQNIKNVWDKLNISMSCFRFLKKYCANLDRVIGCE